MFGKRINLDEIGKQQSIYLKLTGAIAEDQALGLQLFVYSIKGQVNGKRIKQNKC